MEISLELRRRVKEQLKKIGGMEFYDVNFSYTDNDSFEEYYVSVPEQGGGKLIPEEWENQDLSIPFRNQRQECSAVICWKHR